MRQHEEIFRDLLNQVGHAYFERYTEAVIGNPPVVMMDGPPANGRPLNIVDIRAIHDLWRLCRLAGKAEDAALTVVDIGGGFGSLAAKLKKAIPKARVILFDLPEVNVLQSYYLNSVLPGSRILTYRDFLERGQRLPEDGDFDFAILPGWCIERMPDASVDIYVNTRSMMEMNRSTIESYFAAIHRTSKVGGVFYCANRYIKSTAGEDIKIKDYPFDRRWAVLASQPKWNQPQIHELAVLRLDREIDCTPAVAMRALPPRQWADVGDGLKSSAAALRALTLGDNPMINPGLLGKIRASWRQISRGLVRTAFDTLRRFPGVYGSLRSVYRGFRPR